MIKNSILIFVFSLLSLPIVASDMSIASDMPKSTLSSTLFAFGLVISAILGLAWLLKKMRLPSVGNQQGFSIIKQIPVGTKERIAIVKVAEEQFLVGITPHSINLISRLEQPVEEEQVESNQFTSQLAQLLNKNDKK